eukprot:536373-Prymnesium_polylepis.3
MYYERDSECSEVRCQISDEVSLRRVSALLRYLPDPARVYPTCMPQGTATPQDTIGPMHTMLDRAVHGPRHANPRMSPRPHPTNNAQDYGNLGS